MKKKFMLIMIGVFLIFGVVNASAEIDEWWTYGEDEDADEMGELSRYVCDKVNEGSEIFGVCSSEDPVDWYEFDFWTNGIGTFELDLGESNLDADIYLYNDQGVQMYQGYPSGTSKVISNIYCGTDVHYHIKIVYNSGVPHTPYIAKVSLEGISPANLSEIQNIEDVPDYLRNNE
ncbi:MAG: hypothetical protein AAGU27_24745 [Dehalobacterium sp.]